MEYLQPTYTKKKNPFIVYLKLKCNWVPYILSDSSSPAVRQRGEPGSPSPTCPLPTRVTYPFPGSKL